ncbi:prefoldin subunit 5 [Acinetobacter baylyi]|uniref:hypothetical protein n=2 Tax=Acinetobacter baylyi TaxID=202950 RepID=UPI00285D29F6|nr:hypothetical protein [Acinetobacter baylyi]MDR6105826.1 prefoldin subunit 5 [Acinetobacter baylyi]
MRSQVIFEEIQLLSIKERKAIKVNLNYNKLVIYGKNDTGKSTIIKSIFWILGLNPSSLFSDDKLDKNLIGILKIKYLDNYYFFYRNKDSRKLFTFEKQLLIETERNSEWQEYLANFFNYPLSLIQFNNLEEYYIGLQGLLTPYYIDQDTSWNAKWIGPFENLNRYIDFYQQVIEHFTGIISNETIILKQKQKKLITSKKENELKIKIYNQSRNELLGNYHDTDHLPEINEDLFIKNIEESSDILKKSKKLQDELKNEINNIISDRYKVRNLLKSAVNLHNESIADLTVLNEIPNDSTIECPTCGTHHKKTIKANIALEFDIQGIEENIFFLNQQLEELKKQEKSAINKLNLINNEIEKFDIQLDSNVSEEYTFNDILYSYSSKNIRTNIDLNINNIYDDINKINATILDYQNRIEIIDSTDSVKERKEKLKKHIRFFYNQLEIESLTLPNRVHLKPKLSGSSSSRSILAIHLAYILMNYEFTDFPLFPIVIDTIQQNGQDIENLDKIVQVISSVGFTQIILGMETLATNTLDEGFKIHQLENAKFSLLDSDSYNEVMKNINELIHQNTSN